MDQRDVNDIACVEAVPSDDLHLVGDDHMSRTLLPLRNWGEARIIEARDERLRRHAVK